MPSSAVYSTRRVAVAGAGAAQAAGTVGAANAISGGASNALGWYQLGNMMNQQTGGGSMGGWQAANGNYGMSG